MERRTLGTELAGALLRRSREEFESAAAADRTIDMWKAMVEKKLRKEKLRRYREATIDASTMMRTSAGSAMGQKDPQR